MPAGRASWRTTANTTPLPRSWTSSSLNSNSSYMPNQPSTKARIAARPSKMSPNARPSKTASTAKLLITASISRRFPASDSPAHKLHQVGGRGLLGHRPVSIPLLGIVSGAAMSDLRSCPRADLCHLRRLRLSQPLADWQADSLTLEHRTTVLVAPRQSGKSRSLAVG